MWRTKLLLCLLLVSSFVGSPLPDSAVGNVVALSQKGPDISMIYAEIYQQFISTHLICSPKESIEATMLNRISARVFTAAKTYYTSVKSTKELSGYTWEIKLMKGDKADAWCLPGARMLVFTALLPVTQSDASLAVIISHELAHLFLKHGEARMKQYLKDYLHKKDILSAYTDEPVETKDFLNRAFGTGDYVSGAKGFSEEDEKAADKLGMIFCAMAGFNPADAVVFWERMNKLKGTAKQPELLSTHPVNANRLYAMEPELEIIQKKYYKPISFN